MNMSRTSAWVIATFCVLSSAASAAQAQPRFTVALNAAYQATTTDFDDSVNFSYRGDVELASTQTNFPVEGGIVGDGGIGVRFWKSVGAGVAVSYYTSDVAAVTTSSVPHPFFPNRFRTVEGEASGLKREELAVHLQLQYGAQVTEGLHATLFGGPTFFTVNQDLITTVNFNDQYPYDEATFGNVDKRRVKGDTVGFNVGADFRQKLTDKVGMGLLLRYARGTADLSIDDRTISVDAGGFQAGFGIRFLF
jgi:hypothetical protein